MGCQAAYGHRLEQSGSDVPENVRREENFVLSESYPQSAIRHFEDADLLAKGGRIDGAGYLIGYAVECAIKHAVVSTRPALGAPHVHLPRLVEQAKKALHGRRKISILTLLNRPGFMSGWTVDSRYEANGGTNEAKFRAWREDAGRAMSAAGLRRPSK
jgi:hypothetical protein